MEPGCTCPERCLLHNLQDPPIPGELRGESVLSRAAAARRGRHFISPETIIATLARAIGVDPDTLALQWQVEDGEFKGLILYRNLTLDEAESIIPRPTAEADDALGVPREWRDKRHD